MHDPESQGGATIEVWAAPLDVAAPTFDRMVASLSGAERARASRYRAAADARRFSAARGWLRQVLGVELGVEPEAVALSEGPGKPHLVGQRGTCFNLSHAGELAVIAVAGRDVGVDVEPVDEAGRWADVVDMACTAGEATALRRRRPGERGVAFLRTWTAKEAYLKATGAGLSVAPQRVEVGDPRPGPATPVRVAGDSGPPRWWVRSLRPAPGYVGAVAAEGCDWQPRMRTTAELAPAASAGAPRS